MISIGSIWRRWDLHIHTPASYEWKGKPLAEQTHEEQDATWKAITARMNETDVDVFGVMDYWTFDGFIALRRYMRANPTCTSRTVLPGMELRLEAPTDFRLNTHVLLDDSVSDETLGHFVAHLKIGGTDGRPPSKESFIALAKEYDAGKLSVHGFKWDDRRDPAKMLKLGMMTAVVTRESLFQAMKLLPEGQCLLVQPYDTYNGMEGLDWKRHPYTDQFLMRRADIFETREPVAVSLFLGQGYPKKPSVAEDFLQNLGGASKPVMSGSDAHSVADYGIFPNDRVTWYKAQPTFAGLRQVCNEPGQRCHIGESPDKRNHVLDNPIKYMRLLRVMKVAGSTLGEHWFDELEVPLNPGLVAIIGNKGSGKSAIADIIALAGNARCSQFEFLNDKRFRRGENKAKHFRAVVTWCNDIAHEVPLDSDPDPAAPERVRYLPQQFIENLCNEIATGNETDFERELKKVIFSRIPEEQRLKKASLDDLIEFGVAAHRRAIAQQQAAVHTLNNEIVLLERETSEETIRTYRSSLSLKQAELDAHDSSPPQEPPKPTEATADPAVQQALEASENAQAIVDGLEAQLTSLKTERADLVARIALLARLVGHLNNLESALSEFVTEHSSEFSEAGFPLDSVVKVEIRRGEIDVATAAANLRLAEIATTVNGADANPGIEKQIEEAKSAVLKLQSDLAAPQKRYQQYLADLARWNVRKADLIGAVERPDTIEFLKARIDAAEGSLPAKLSELRQQRLERVREIHKELASIRDVYRSYYSSVEEIARRAEFSKDAMQLRFDAFLSASRFEEAFLEFIHRARTGNFYGDVESRKAVQSILGKFDLDTADGAVHFVEAIMKALTTYERDGKTQSLSIQPQLKGNRKVSEFYEFLFDLKYLEPRYTLKLGDKDISQLSPGEKGALLLVFYLLLDPGEIPIIIDQPEQNLDNQSVVRLLVDCIRRATARRQVIIVTHNPNLAVVCDADQVIHVSIDKASGHKVSLSAGAIEDHPINRAAVDVLEGTFPAFDNRRKKYQKPLFDVTSSVTGPST